MHRIAVTAAVPRISDGCGVACRALASMERTIVTCNLASASNLSNYHATETHMLVNGIANAVAQQL